jgi:hypothetical protein
MGVFAVAGVAASATTDAATTSIKVANIVEIFLPKVIFFTSPLFSNSDASGAPKVRLTRDEGKGFSH